MSAVVFLLVCFLSCSVSEDLQITAHRGRDVTLPCRAPNYAITAVKWTRSNLDRSDSDRQIFFKRDGHLVTANQDPSYVNRVQLKDDEMKNGDLSLILKNVNNNDEGAYECLYAEVTATKIKPIKIVILHVGDLQITEITAQPGDDVTLPCEARNVLIADVLWTRSDLKRHVFFKSHGHLKTADQDPSYVNRVQLDDDEMKNGELSLILKNVKKNDTGTYKCHHVGETAEQIKLSSFVQLIVEGGDSRDGKDTDGHSKSGKLPESPGLIITLIVVVVVVVGVVVFGFRIYKRFKVIEYMVLDEQDRMRNDIEN